MSTASWDMSTCGKNTVGTRAPAAGTAYLTVPVAGIAIQYNMKQEGELTADSSKMN
jgi:hypothetical protein